MDEEEGVRLFFHNLLVSLFPGFDIYYRPPGNLILERPCIIYSPTGFVMKYANNVAYVVGTKFQLTILSDLPGISGLRAIFDLDSIVVGSNRTYVTNDIVHDVFNVYVHSI